MAVFNTNQVRQLYVVTGVNEAVNKTIDLSAKSVGYIVPVVDDTTTPTKLHFSYKGKGGNLRSDLIDLKKATYYTVTDPTNDVYTLKAKKVSLRSDVNGGDPVAGQDYILGLEIKGFVSGFEEDTYTKQGMVHAFSNMDAATFYNVLALSLWMNFSRETTKFFTFWLDSENDGPTLVDEAKARLIKQDLKNGTTTNLVTDATGVIIQEAPMDWSLGRMQEEHLFFDVSGDTIVFNGDELMWASITDVASADQPNDPVLGGITIPNSHRIADLEYFCMGERNTLYRGMDWPNSIFDPSMLMVNPANATGYYVLNLHYAFTDSREGVQRSEKDITFVFDIASHVTDHIETITDILDDAGVKQITRSTGE